MRFNDWMLKTGETNAAFGQRASWASETVRRYRTGEREPDQKAMARIFELTDGQVTPNDWVGVGPRNHTIENAEQGS